MAEIEREGLALRVQGLVDRFHGGSVNAAARQAGVEQQTMRRIVLGDIQNPRSDTLRRIADANGATIDWLLTGRGSEPEGPDAAIHRVIADPETVTSGGNWLSLVKELELPEELHAEMVSWPFAPTVTDLTLSLTLGAERQEDAARNAMKATRAMAAAWHAFLTGLIALYGRERIRDALIERAADLQDGRPLTVLANALLASPAAGQWMKAAPHPARSRDDRHLYEDLETRKRKRRKRKSA